MGCSSVCNKRWSCRHLYWSPIFRVGNCSSMAVQRLTTSEIWNPMSQCLRHKQMYENSFLQLFAKSDRATGLSAKQRRQRVLNPSNCGSSVFKNNGFVNKWKLWTAFCVHCNRLSICLGFVFVSPLENHNTEHILLEVSSPAEYSGPWNGDRSRTPSPAEALQPLYPKKPHCRVPAGTEHPTTSELDLKNSQMLHSPRRTLAMIC